MNLTGKNTVETSDYSYLNADELRAALLEKDADLEAKNSDLEAKNASFLMLMLNSPKSQQIEINTKPLPMSYCA